MLNSVDHSPDTFDPPPNPDSELMPVVYAELKRLADFYLSSDQESLTLTPTTLVHEAWIRLESVSQSASTSDRASFLQAAANSMRRILVEHAQRNQRQHIVLESSGTAILQKSELRSDRQLELLAVDEVLTLFRELHPEKAELVTLRYFGGLTLPEAAELLGISLQKANRHWAYARAWLGREISRQADVA